MGGAFRLLLDMEEPTLFHRHCLRATLAALVLGVAGASFAVDKDSVTFNGWQPVQTTNFPSGSLQTNVFTVGGYNLGKIRFEGTVNNIDPGDWLSESRIRVQMPDGRYKDVQLSTQLSYTSPAFVAGEFNLGLNTPAPFGGGTWSYYYINTYDDGGNGMPDCSLDITFYLTDEVPAPPPPPAGAIDLGVVGAPGLSRTDFHVGGDVWWYRIELGNNTLAGRFFDMDTIGTTTFLGGTYDNDTYIALFDLYGNLIAFDDDDGANNSWTPPFGPSQLTFGPDAGNRGDLGYGCEPFDGRDGNLDQGVYYLAVGGFPLTLGSPFIATTTSAHVGDVVVNLRTNIPGGAVVSGNITLEGRDAGTEVGQQVVVEIRNVGSTTPIHTEMVTLGLNGAYSFNLPGAITPGNYDIAAKHAKSLRKNMGNQTITGSGISGLNFSLFGGDCDDDNEITIGDYALISFSFNTCFPDPGYDDRADCTGDTCVDIGDFAIMSQNFGMLGDD